MKSLVRAGGAGVFSLFFGQVTAQLIIEAGLAQSEPIGCSELSPMTPHKALFRDFKPNRGSGKQRTKEPKKKNTKQKLRVRAQNQHSDHLSSVRSSHRD
ncbi:unnamed protein product [Arctogadus glacialis]